jgi:multiple sugar transport system permease protein/raffinose/stachyose/melibiose transport system permease protein
MSFYNTDGLASSNFVGIDNFTQLLTDDSFKRANISSIFLCFFAILGDAVLGIAVAILISTLRSRLQKIYRVAFLIPMVLSISVIAQLWLAVYHAEWGLLNSLFDAIKLGNLKNSWLINENTAMVCIAIVGMWWIFGLIVLLAYSGLKTIPAQYYEAAKIDGAGFLQTTFKITLPLLSEVTKVCFILSAVGGLYTFPQVYIMTGGGPGDITQTLMMYMYKQVFSNQRFGLGSAIAVLAIVESSIIIFFINKLIGRKNIQF